MNGAGEPAGADATTRVEDIVLKDKATFSEALVQRMHQCGTFERIIRASTMQIHTAGATLKYAVKLNTYWSIILFHAWMQHFKALEPAWQRTPGPDDGADIRAAGLTKLTTFTGGNKCIQVCDRWSICERGRAIPCERHPMQNGPR